MVEASLEMKLRNTLILLAVLAALAAYVLLVEVKKPSPDAEATPFPTAIAPILSYNAADVRALRLSSPSQNQRTELVYEGDGKWYVTVPVRDEADQDEVTYIINELTSLSPQRVLTESLGSLADYELDPPAILAEIELKDGLTRTLKVGAQDAVGSGYYAQVVGDERVYLVSYYIGSDLERALSQPPVRPTPEPMPTQEEVGTPLSPTATSSP